MSFDCGSSTLGSCSASEYRHDSELDVRVMRTLNDVKFRNRPKCIIFGDVNFQRECLDAHNACRQRHGCAPLEWSQELADLARTWAEKLAEKGRLLYPELPGLGENIYLGSASEISHLPSGQELSEQWAQEAAKYDYNKPRWMPSCQHFTQMVWRDSYEMGAARCWLPGKANGNRVAVVCFYRPGGNVNTPGEFQLNVPRPLSPTELRALELDNSDQPQGERASSLRTNRSTRSEYPYLRTTTENGNHEGAPDESPVGELPGAFRRKLRLARADSPPISTASEPARRIKGSGKFASSSNHNANRVENNAANSIASDAPTTTAMAAGSTKSTPAKRTSRTIRRARFWFFSRFRRRAPSSRSTT